MSLTSEREEIEMWLANINDFDKQCTDAEYTDTGQAWQIINGAKAALTTALERYDLMGWAE